MSYAVPSLPARRPAISVLIPAHRAARFITPTLESIRAQSLPPVEILIFEDGQLDDLARHLADFAATSPLPVRHLVSVLNQGVSKARNRLLQEARGEFVAFLDADDIWEPDHLQLAADAFAAGADVAFSGVSFIDPEGRPLGRPSCPTASDMATLASALYTYNFVQCTSTLTMRRAWVNRVGGFDETLSHGEDLDLWLRLIAGGADFRCTGHCSCRYRKHGASAMAQTSLMVERMSRFYEKHLHNPLIPRRQRRRSLGNSLRTLTRLLARSNPRRAVAAAERLLQVDPWRPNNLAACAWAFWNARRLLLSAHRRQTS